MQKVQLTPEVLEKLTGAGFSAELCDEAGATRAVVLPVDLYREMLRAWSNDPFDPEQLARARAEPGGYTTAEVLARIREMEEQYRRRA